MPFPFSSYSQTLHLLTHLTLCTYVLSLSLKEAKQEIKSKQTKKIKKLRNACKTKPQNSFNVGLILLTFWIIGPVLNYGWYYLVTLYWWKIIFPLFRKYQLQRTSWLVLRLGVHISMLGFCPVWIWTGLVHAFTVSLSLYIYHL